MTDQDKAKGDQADGSPAPSPTMASEPRHEAAIRSPSRSDGPAETGSRPTGTFLRQLNANEQITAFLALASLVVAVGSLAVAYLTYRVSADTSDLKGAVRNLAALAAQTKRQADAVDGEMKQLRRQADATAQMVRPAQESAAAAIRGVALQNRNFRTDIRPRLGLGDGPQVFDRVGFLPDGRFAWNYVLENYGRSNARKITVKQWIKIGDESLKLVGIADTPDLPPTQRMLGTGIYRGTLNRELIDRLLHSRSGAAILKLDLSYQDELGDHFADSICEATLQNGAIAICSTSPDGSVSY